MSQPRFGVVFDLDDTLYAERDYVRSGFEAASIYARKQFGVTDFAEAAWTLFERGQRGNIFNRVLENCGVIAQQESVSKLVETYRVHRPNIRLFPDAQDCLQRLPPEWFLGIITDGYWASQRLKVTALGLQRCVKVVLFTDDWGKQYWKPHPMAFRLIEQRYMLAPRSLVYVGDNPHKDFSAPKNRGWHTIRVRRPNSLHFETDNVPTSEPDVNLADFASLSDCLRDMIPSELQMSYHCTLSSNKQLSRVT
jgi:putative hydrolase of the HAD superfamily